MRRPPPIEVSTDCTAGCARRKAFGTPRMRAGRCRSSSVGIITTSLGRNFQWRLYASLTPRLEQIPLPASFEFGRPVVEHKLYWSPVATESEARYLSGILNCEVARAKAETWQSRGQWGARDFDKVIFNLPIPRFDPKNKLHGSLAKAAAVAEKVAATVELPEGVKFQRARGLVRSALTAAGVAKRIDDLVTRLLDPLGD